MAGPRRGGIELLTEWKEIIWIADRAPAGQSAYAGGFETSVSTASAAGRRWRGALGNAAGDMGAGGHDLGLPTAIRARTAAGEINDVIGIVCARIGLETTIITIRTV